MILLKRHANIRTYTHVFKLGFFSFSFSISSFEMAFYIQNNTLFSLVSNALVVACFIKPHIVCANVYYSAAVNESSKRWWIKTQGNLSVLHLMTPKLSHRSAMTVRQIVIVETRMRACVLLLCLHYKKDQCKWIMEGA